MQPLTPEEKAVCDRLAALRRLGGRSQEAFAQALCLTRNQLAYIEMGRGFVHFLTGWSACKDAGASQLWLAFGEPPMAPFLRVTLEESSISHASSFREACQSEPLAARLQRKREELIYQAKATKLLEETGYPSDSRILSGNIEFVDAMTHNLLLSLPPGKQDLAVSALKKTVEELWAQQKTEKNPLTAESIVRNMSGMKPGLQALLHQVRRLTKAKGMKAKLAAHIGVPQSRLSEWLAGKHEPSGEVALRLLYWAEQEEAQPKQSPAGASTSAGKGPS